MKIEDWRLNWRGMNIAQKLLDSIVGSHGTAGEVQPLTQSPSQFKPWYQLCWQHSVLCNCTPISNANS